ncbi:3-hydroxyacyl-CoA dehydrogenase NAD-binding domain-containing protein [Aestuariirhabdus sp. Z084]|uniref:3-hydroxyacyl-CoA dehydrogenase NAD-binding domain-containing protein n=1 Tax=Aestuariirhabdus haliotis TaxID=2918751 RepID=UPI00201B41E3|nr:3-hydroxyacyl-CoA dehydrogenase NAD-binding domain-containing protein [Aestuariirhabdus haliotis]MCL6415572.1 3-hydroxyacyl-CoA dehydrogenase NAD-binding domain-containing protein [Aestuariirhabdus haliotis]MCL6419223.1 3-hydroxyacyl-CoA dehydrogenase NAD-binding domain-containing protein [Aestuariirhabdus haliotis]
MSAIRFEKDADNIVTLVLDNPGQSANTMNADFREALTDVVTRIEQEQDSISGILVTSAKSTFFAGGDLKELVAVEDAAEFYAMVNRIKEGMRRLETLGKPVVAAINGAALGGGWEIALACHHRICLNSPKVSLGLPEVTLGLLPGGGGVVRMVRLLGLEKSLPYLLEGKQLKAEAALKAGWVQELVDTPEQLVERGKAWIKDNPKSSQPWDEKGYRMPGGTPSSPKVFQMLSVAPAMLRQKTKGCFPAPEKILAAAVEGAQVDFDNACLIESRYFTELVTSPVAKNMINTFWFQLNDIKAGGSRPQGIDTYTTQKVGVIGAGMMGAGIAYQAAISGIDVVLKDISMESAEKGKSYSEQLLAKRVSRGRMTEEKKAGILARIQATDNSEAFADCDLIIEAVFEDRGLKARVTAEAEAICGDNTLVASNTSTLPITGLAEAVQNPDRFIGLHFFSPVDKMPLVEIICGKQTSDEALARAFDFVLQIRKTPIVVNDSRGFFTSRVFGTFTNEGIAMLGEGVEPALIEKEALKAGMPVGPLAISDEVSMSLMKHIRKQTEADLAAEGATIPNHPANAVIDAMVEDLDRQGRAAGGGFYDYPSQGKKHLWSGLREQFVRSDLQISKQDVRDRMLFIQAIETVRCLEENVLRSVADANIGSIFGIGFAAWSGGALQFINQYGLTSFVDRAHYLAEQYGERFEPPALLQEMAASGKRFE